MKKLLAGIYLVLLFCGSANAALLSRASGQAYYDTVLGITWMADANLGDTNSFGVTGINTDGAMTWAKANEWIAAMNTAAYLGVNDWRLPTVNPVNGSSFDYSVSFNGSTDDGQNVSEQGTAYAGSAGSEMAHLYYNTLNNKAFCDPVLSTASICSGPQSGWGLVNAGPFSNLQASPYWSGITYAPNTNAAWVFNFGDGGQSSFVKSGGNVASSVYAWAVRPGDIAAVPGPGTLWLLATALAGLSGALRRRTRNRAQA